MHVCVCLCEWVYRGMWVCMGLHVYMYGWSICMCLCIWMCLCMHVGMNVCWCKCLNMFVCVYICFSVWSLCMYLCVNIWVSIYVNMCGEVQMYICVYWVVYVGVGVCFFLLPWDVKSQRHPEEWRLWEMERQICSCPTNQRPQPTLRSSGVQWKFHPNWVLGLPHTSWTSQANLMFPHPWWL